MRALLHKVEHPTLPVDLLYYEDITLHELAAGIKNLNSDKSPGDDGITNHMIQAAGPTYTDLARGVQHVMGTRNPTGSVANVPYAANLQGW